MTYDELTLEELLYEADHANLWPTYAYTRWLAEYYYPTRATLIKLLEQNQNNHEMGTS